MAIRRRRAITLAAAVATAAALTTFGTVTAAAAETPLTDYTLTWGIKESFRSYVVGPYTQGTFTAADGATQADGNGAFTFTDGEGTYDTTTHAVDLAFKGSLKISLHGIDIVLSDVRLDGGAGEITADVAKEGTTQDDVPLAGLTLTQDMKEMATTLTTEAGDVFGSAGYAGAAGDPLTVAKAERPSTGTPTATPTETATRTPEPTASTSPSASASASTSPSASASPDPTGTAEPAPAKGEIADGTLGWGVKESFRTYVVGSVAKGEITASGGASQASGNGVFTFTGATGSYDTDADTLSASFEGAVEFKGHEGAGEDGGYGLDLTLSDLKATLDGGTGTLTADVTSLGEKSEDVVLADLKAKSADLSAEDDVITADGVTATLTEAGAEAFAGFYTAGTALDTADLSVALTEDAELPAGGAGSTAGSGTTDPADATGTTGASGTTSGGTGSTTGGTGVTGGSLASTGADLPAPAVGAAAALAVAAGAGVVIAVRRRRPVSD
jgi:hypothetical protein